MASLGGVTVQCPACATDLIIPIKLIGPTLHVIGGPLVVDIHPDGAVISKHAAECPGPPNDGGREQLLVAA